MPDNQTVPHSQSIFDQKNDFREVSLFTTRGVPGIWGDRRIFGTLRGEAEEFYISYLKH